MKRILQCRSRPQWLVIENIFNNIDKSVREDFGSNSERLSGVLQAFKNARWYSGSSQMRGTKHVDSDNVHGRDFALIGAITVLRFPWSRVDIRVIGFFRIGERVWSSNISDSFLVQWSSCFFGRTHTSWHVFARSATVAGDYFDTSSSIIMFGTGSLLDTSTKLLTTYFISIFFT